MTHLLFHLTAQVVCDKNLLITSVTFKEAFHGVIYAKGYPKDDCIVYGNGSKVIHISTNIHDCGVKIDKKKVGVESEVGKFLWLGLGKRVKFIGKKVRFSCITWWKRDVI